MSDTPESLTIVSYQVGFGDCFLLRFDYGDRRRHVLVDFGTTGLPEETERGHMIRVARDIKDRCGGHLEAIVATHRHADHISGFATRADGTGPGDVIRTITVDRVLQPWTEAPDAAIDGLTLAPSEHKAMRGSIATLKLMHENAAALVAMVDSGMLAHAPAAVREQLAFIGRDNLSNLSAVENLMWLGRDDRARYVHHGADAGLDGLLPGVTTHVLGPPTLAQSTAIRRQRARDSAEYWHLALTALKSDQLRAKRSATDRASLFPAAETRRRGRLPAETRWLAQRLDTGRGEQMLSLVRALDRAMNNTSLILLFDVGGKKLLFPGDAQIECWSHALAHDADLLADVELLKVGHHGSLNATPKSLWRLLKRRGKPGTAGRLTSLLSTRPGKHGHVEDGTEVPRSTLLSDLSASSDLHSTHLLPPGVLCEEITLTFAPSAPPRRPRAPAA